MTKQGKELEFICRILRDGSGVAKINSQEEVSHVQDTNFKMVCLSITEGTWIAAEFNVYVVKIKI